MPDVGWPGKDRLGTRCIVRHRQRQSPTRSGSTVTPIASTADIDVQVKIGSEAGLTSDWLFPVSSQNGIDELRVLHVGQGDAVAVCDHKKSSCTSIMAVAPIIRTREWVPGYAEPATHLRRSCGRADALGKGSLFLRDQG